MLNRKFEVMQAPCSQAEMLVIEEFLNTRQPGPLTTRKIDKNLAPRFPGRTVVAIKGKVKKIKANARARRQGNEVPQGRIAAVRTDIRWMTTEDDESRLVDRFQQEPGRPY